MKRIPVYLNEDELKLLIACINTELEQGDEAFKDLIRLKTRLNEELNTFDDGPNYEKDENE